MLAQSFLASNRGVEMILNILTGIGFFVTVIVLSLIFLELWEFFWSLVDALLDIRGLDKRVELIETKLAKKQRGRKHV
jgi:hypothetical protein